MIKERSDGYNQVCVWPATIVPDNEVEEFETWFMNEFNTRVQFLETILTAPDIKDGSPVPDSGGRSNGEWSIYPDHVSDYKSW